MNFKLDRESSIGDEGRFAVIIDGKRVGTLGFLKNFEMQLEPGKHYVKVRYGLWSSKVFEFNIKEGKVTHLCCGQPNALSNVSYFQAAKMVFTTPKSLYFIMHKRAFKDQK